MIQTNAPLTVPLIGATRVTLAPEPGATRCAMQQRKVLVAAAPSVTKTLKDKELIGMEHYDLLPSRSPNAEQLAQALAGLEAAA